MPIVKPIHAQEGEVVDIHWRLRDGTVYVERVGGPPPKATRDVRPSIDAPAQERD